MKKSRGKKARKAAAVELTETELGGVAGGGGGGIYNTGGVLTLTDSTISGNRSTTGSGDDILIGGTILDGDPPSSR